MRVEMGKKLLYQLQQLVKEEILEEDQIDKVFNFVKHVSANGLKNLEGRNKDSSNVPLHVDDYAARVAKAVAKKWWHYHIGISLYEQRRSFGDKTSEYVIHYSNYSPYYIRLGKLDYHPPFRIPNDNWLNIR